MMLYVLRRLTAGLVLAVLVTTITFLLLSTSFDDVASSVLGNGATPGQVAAQIAQDQLQRPAERAVSAGDIAEDVLTAPESKILAHRPVDDDQRRREMRGRLHAVEVEALVARGADERDEHAHHGRR